MLKFSFRRQVLAGFVISIILVLVVGVLAYTSIRHLEDDTDWVDHTQKVIKSSNNLLQHLIDADDRIPRLSHQEPPDRYKTLVGGILQPVLHAHITPAIGERDIIKASFGFSAGVRRIKPQFEPRGWHARVLYQRGRDVDPVCKCIRRRGR